MITTLAISGYRSLRDVIVALHQLNVVTGPNGSGKSNLYRSLRLLANIAHGHIVRTIAQEGGFRSTFWAGPEQFSRAMRAGTQAVQGTVRDKSIALKLGFATDDYGYAIDLGLPVPGSSPFETDPHLKAESLWVGQVLSPRNEIASRKGPGVRVRDEQGNWAQVLTDLSVFDSMMTHAADPKGGVELLRLRDHMRGWRFYDHFRTDRDAPCRHPQVGTYTPVLASDGSDLAAAVITLKKIGQLQDFDATIEDAFPGAWIGVEGESIVMHQKGLLRPLTLAELSDGTLRYLLLATALLSPRPPAFLVLNEPEMSLHPDLLPALARLIAKAAELSQIIVVSHSDRLISALEETAPANKIALEKQLGETHIVGGERPVWKWPARL